MLRQLRAALALRRSLATSPAPQAPALQPPPAGLLEHASAFMSSLPGQVGITLTILGSVAALATLFVDARVSMAVSDLREQLAGLRAEHKAQVQSMYDKTTVQAQSMYGKTTDLAISIRKEVDAKTAGLEKKVDAKTSALAKEVDAKVASVVASAASTAEAETLRVFKELKVRSLVPCPSCALKMPHFFAPPAPPTPSLPDLRGRQVLRLALTPARAATCHPPPPQPLLLLYSCLLLYLYC
jgi:hypothetical protein